MFTKVKHEKIQNFRVNFEILHIYTNGRTDMISVLFLWIK